MTIDLFEYTNPETKNRIIILVSDIISLRCSGMFTEIETVSGRLWPLREHPTWASAYLELEELKDAIFS